MEPKPLTSDSSPRTTMILDLCVELLHEIGSEVRGTCSTTSLVTHVMLYVPDCPSRPESAARSVQTTQIRHRASVLRIFRPRVEYRQARGRKSVAARNTSCRSDWMVFLPNAHDPVSLVYRRTTTCKDAHAEASEARATVIYGSPVRAVSISPQNLATRRTF